MESMSENVNLGLVPVDYVAVEPYFARLVHWS